MALTEAQRTALKWHLLLERSKIYFKVSIQQCCTMNTFLRETRCLPLVATSFRWGLNDQRAGIFREAGGRPLLDDKYGKACCSQSWQVSEKWKNILFVSILIVTLLLVKSFYKEAFFETSYSKFPSTGYSFTQFKNWIKSKSAFLQTSRSGGVQSKSVWKRENSSCPCFKTVPEILRSSSVCNPHCDTALQ